MGLGFKAYLAAVCIGYCPKPGRYAVLRTQGMPPRAEPEMVSWGFLKLQLRAITILDYGSLFNRGGLVATGLALVN